MKGAVLTGNRTCEVREFPEPVPGHGEVVLRIEATGICGSDLHVYRGERDMDQIGGHEPAGTVVDVGEGIVRLRRGDRVSVHHHHGCGVCDQCARGETVACRYRHQVYGVGRPGSFAELMAAGEANCIPLPQPLTFADGACIACVGTTAYAALRRLQARPHETLAVFGLGPVGLSTVIVARAMGLRVIGMDIIPERLELGMQCGAQEVIDGREEGAVERIHAFSRTPGIDWVEGVGCLVETSGATAARELMLPAIRRGGRIAIVGVGSDEAVINPTAIHGKACTIIGSVVFPLGWSWDVVRFLVASGTSFEPMITHRFGLHDAPEALHTADEGRCGKVIIEP
ncbi:MAG: alcohol dehydrogenase catalytic domain-containing protein [Armatimonadota bacterium]|nr:alcohol dehydrogenase catalytic domain-containing protein [Armatimonadota bacterium]